nr:unnamed protein product [Leishmania braziliensis]
MSSLAPSSFTGPPTGSFQVLWPPRDDVIAAPLGTVPVDFSSPLPVPLSTRGDEPDSVSRAGTGSSSTFDGPFSPLAMVGVMHRGSTGSGSGVGAGVLRGLLTPAGSFTAAHQQARYPPRQWQARSTSPSAAVRNPPNSSLSSSAAATGAPPAAATTASGIASPQSRNPGPSSHGATRLVSSHGIQDDSAAPPRSSRASLRWVVEEPTHTGGREMAGTLAATLGQVNASDGSGDCSASMQPSSAQLTLAATVNSSVPPYTSRVWQASTTPPFQYPPQAPCTGHRADCIGTGGISGERTASPLPSSVAAGTAALSGATEGTAPRSCVPVMLPTSSSLSSSSLPMRPPSHAGLLAAAPTAGSLPMTSIKRIATGAGAVGMGNAVACAIPSLCDASVARLRHSDPEARAAAAELADGQQQPQHCQLQGHIGVAVDVSAVVGSCEGSDGAGNNRSPRQSRPRGSVSASSHAFRACRSQQPSRQLAESGKHVDGEEKGKPAHQRLWLSHDNSELSGLGPSSSAPGAFSMDCGRDREAPPFVAARSWSSSLTESSSRSPLAASVAQLHGCHTASTAAALGFSTQTPPLALVTVPSAATSTAPLAPPALPSWKRGKLRRLAAPSLGGAGLVGRKLPPTVSAAASIIQGRSPRTPRSQREAHLMSLMRVALIDARSVRSHLEELRALLPKHRSGPAGATTAQDISGAIAGNSESAEATYRATAAAAVDTGHAQHTGPSGVADVRAGDDDEAGGVDNMLNSSDDPVGIVEWTTAMSPASFSLRQKVLRDKKTDGIGGGGDGGSNILQARANDGKASSQLPCSQGLHWNGSDVDGDGNNDGDGSPAATFNVRGLYTSSLNGYRHQRLTRLTEQHLKSLWLGISVVAKSVCGVAVEDCARMALAQGQAPMDEQALGSPCERGAAMSATPPSPPSTAVTASPTPCDPPKPSSAAVTAQDGEATTAKNASSGASKPLLSEDPPDTIPSFHFSSPALAAAPAERRTLACGEQAPTTAATMRRLGGPMRGNPSSGRHRDTQHRCFDEAALLDSVSAGGNGSAPSSLLGRTAVLAAAANGSPTVFTGDEEGSRMSFSSSTAAPTSLARRTSASPSTSTALAQCTYSDCYRSGDSNSSSHHHSTTSPTSLSKWRNTSPSGTIYIHNTMTSLSSAETTSVLDDAPSSSGSRMHNSSSSSSARGGGGGYAVGTSGSALSGLPRPAIPTTAMTGGGGQSLYTLPSTLLPLPALQQGSLSQLAPSTRIGGAAPPNNYRPPPVATVTHLSPPLHQPLAHGGTAPTSAPPTAVPHHSPSSAWYSEVGVDGGAADISSSCPLAAGTSGSMWMLPLPSPVPPPPPVAVHPRGTTTRGGGGGASRVSAVVPTVPSASSTSYGAANSGAGGGASALQRPCARSSGVVPATPFTSPPSATSTPTLLFAMPSPPVKAPFIKVQREEVAADTTPDLDSNARAGIVPCAAAVVTAAMSASGTAIHAQGEGCGRAPTSSALPLTGHERPGEIGMEARSGTALPPSSAAAAAVVMVAQDEMSRAPHNVGAAATLPPAIASSHDTQIEGERSDVPPTYGSMELIACERHGSDDIPTPSGAALVMMPDSLLTRQSGADTCTYYSPVLRSAATGTAATFALSADGDNQLEESSESDGADAAGKAPHKLPAHAASEGAARAGKVSREDVIDGAGASSGFSNVYESAASPPSLPQRQSERGAASAAAHPCVAPARGLSFSYATILASRAEAASAVATTMTVAEACISSSAPSATPPPPPRAEPQPRHRDDGRSSPPPMPTSDSALHDLRGGEDADRTVKRSSSSSGSGSSNIVVGSTLQTPPQVALPGTPTKDRSLHAVPQWAQLHPPQTPTSTTTSLETRSADSAGVLWMQTGDEEEVNAMSALACAASLPVHPSSSATDERESCPPPFLPTLTELIRTEVVHSTPATEAKLREGATLAKQFKGEESAADTPSSMVPFPTLQSWAAHVGRHAGLCISSAAAALDVEQSEALTTSLQLSGSVCMPAYADRYTGEDCGGASEAKEAKGDVATDEATVRDSEDGRDLLSFYVNIDAHDLPSPSQCASARHQALQQHQHHQHQLMQTWSSILTISSSGHSAATASSLRTTLTSVTLSASMAALGSRLNTSSTMTSGSSTALPSVAETILGISVAAGGGGDVGAACDTDFDAPCLSTTFNSTFTSTARTQHVLSRLKPLPHLSPPQNYPFPLLGVSSPYVLDYRGFEEDGDDVDTDSYTQDTDDTDLLGADPEFEDEGRHRTETPVCGEASGGGSAYDDSGVEDRGAVAKSAASPSQCHEDGKDGVEASPTQPLPESSTSEAKPFTTLAGSTAVAVAGASGQCGAAAPTRHDRSSRGGRSGVSSHAIRTAALESQALPTAPFPEGASLLTATVDDGGARGTSAYAVVTSRAALVQASRAIEEDKDEDDNTTEDGTSSAHLSMRSLGVPMAQLPAPVGADSTTTAADTVTTLVGKGEANTILEGRGDPLGMDKGIQMAAAMAPSAQAACDVESSELEDAASVVMVEVTREHTEEALTVGAVTFLVAAAAAAPIALLQTSPSSPSSSSSDAHATPVRCSHESQSRCPPPALLVSGPIDRVRVDTAALSPSAGKEKLKKRHDGDRRAADASAVLSGASLETGGALPITSTPLAVTTALRATGASGSDGLIPCLPPEAASSAAPARAPSTIPLEPRERPSPPLPQTRFSLPSYYLAQCEDGLADVAGSLHRWHAETSAFFPETESASTPCRTHGRRNGSSGGAAHLYLSISALARRRAQQRAFYNSAGLSGSAALPPMKATAVDMLSSASAMPVLPSRASATPDDTEKAATSPTLSSAAAGATHNDRLLGSMVRALWLTGGGDDGGGAC